MLSFFRIVTHAKPLDIWQHVQPLRFFSVSSRRGSTWSKDPTERREQRDRHNAWLRERYAQDAVYRERRHENRRAYVQAKSDSEMRDYKRRDAFRNWVFRGLRSGAVRTWRTHTPEYSSVRETRLCSECGFYHHKTLWWKRKDRHGVYDCNGCFMSDWSRVHPIGYEHLTFAKKPAKGKRETESPSDEASDHVEAPAGSKP